VDNSTKPRLLITGKSFAFAANLSGAGGAKCDFFDQPRFLRDQANAIRRKRIEKQIGEQGRDGLKKAGRAGRKSRLREADLKRLESGLKRGPQALGYETNLWTLERVAELIERNCGVKYHPGHVGWLLGKLGWSCQRPTGRALQRDEPAIGRWKKRRWPELKKKPSKKAAR
jgi:transposase